MFAFLFVFFCVVFSQKAPESFDVTFHTTVKNGTSGIIKFNIHRAWSPIGVDRFYELLMDNYYNKNAFFRVLPNFVAQFGINGDPSESKKWQNKKIKDDPVVKSNLKGTISFATAGPDTRTTQLFINFVDNKYLDNQGFSPFGMVVDEESMNTALSINSQYLQKPDQGQIYKLGNAYLEEKFPGLDYIQKAVVHNEIW